MPKQARKQPAMTPNEAMTFDNFSVQNVVALQAHFGCGCEPYKDIFTYGRWQALGRQVQRGEKGFKIQTIRTFTETKGGKEVIKKVPWTTTVFCLHQVKPREEKV